MECLGAAADNNGFVQLLEQGQRPLPSSIVYEGVFNSHYIKASTTRRVLEPFGHCGLDRNGNLLLGVEIVSGKNGLPRDGTVALDLVVAIDISGSMSSHLGGQRVSKLEAAKSFAILLSQKLDEDDTIAVITFESNAATILEPSLKQELGDKLESVVTPLQTRGGTHISGGLTEAFAVARKAKAFNKDRGSVNPRTSRIVLLTDMSDGEVNDARTVIMDTTLEMAKEDIYVTYVGIGEDFDQSLTEVITVAEGSNYFCIMTTEDFTTRIANEFASAFFPTVKNIQLLLTAKQYLVNGIYGAGKSEKSEVADRQGWKQENQHLYGGAVQETVSQLHSHNLPNDMVAQIVGLSTSEKPITVVQENSIFPAPSAQDTNPGYMKGGWILIAIEPDKQTKGSAKGFVRFELIYTQIDGTIGKAELEIDLEEVEKQQKNGARNWSASEGMVKAMVLKQYVDVVKEVLADTTLKEFPPEFVSWFTSQHKTFNLTEEADNLKKLQALIGNDDKEVQGSGTKDSAKSDCILQ